MDAPVSNRPSATEVLSTLPPGRRWGIGAGAVAIVIAGVVTLRIQPENDRVPLLNGKTFTEAEANEAARQLASAGLTEFSIENGVMCAPAGDRQRYESILRQAPRESGGWVTRWQEADSLLGQFADGRQLQLHRDEERARLIGELLSRLPEIEHAEIVWDEEPRVGWRRPPRVRGAVYLQSKPGREVSVETVQAVRLAVAGSKAHLDPADVVVMDLAGMVTYLGGHDTPPQTREERISRQTSALRSRIESALSEIEGVRVSVAIADPDRSADDPSHRAAAESVRAPNAPFLSVSNAGMEVAPDGAGRTHSTEPSDPVSSNSLPNGAGEEVSQIGSVNVVVRIPSEHLQQLVAARLLPGSQVPPEESERLVAQVDQTLKGTVRRRVSDLLMQSGLQPAVFVETEPIQFAALGLPPAPSSKPWFLSAIGGAGARTWSVWAVVFGFGASLCWWLRDVIEWHAQKPSSRGKPMDRSASAGERPADDSVPDAQHRTPLPVPIAPVSNLESLLAQDSAAVRRFYSSLPPQVWALALRGEREGVLSRLLGILDAPRAAELRSEIRAHRPVRLRDIEDAQQRILSDWANAAPRAA